MSSANAISFNYEDVLRVIKAVLITANSTSTIVEPATATETARAHMPEGTVAPQISNNVPHLPKVDIAFAAIFGAACLVLLLGTILRRKSKKVKSFNIPLMIGIFCIISVIH